MTRLSIFFLTIILIGLLFSPIAFADPSNSISVSALVVGNSSSSSSTSNISGGGGYTAPINVFFSGYAYPFSVVTLLQDGTEILQTTALGDGSFSLSVSNLSQGVYLFSLSAIDENNNQSNLFTIPLNILPETSVTVSKIFLAPTVLLNQSEVQSGTALTVSGQTIPNGLISIYTDSNNTPNTVIAGTDGAYLYTLDTTNLSFGDHTIYVIATTPDGSEISTKSTLNTFTIGNITKTNSIDCPKEGDINHDCEVNIVDFSILAYWFNRSSPPSDVDLNGDGQIDLKDFSILAYYWTGSL